MASKALLQLNNQRLSKHPERVGSAKTRSMSEKTKRTAEKRRNVKFVYRSELLDHIRAILHLLAELKSAVSVNQCKEAVISEDNARI